METHQKKKKKNTRGTDQAMPQNAVINKVIWIPVHLKATGKPGGSLLAPS